MKILITGAAGFLGSNLVQHMAKAHPAAEIIAADSNPSQPTPAQPTPALGSYSFHNLDVTDGAACRRLMELSRPTHIVHAAAVTLDETLSARQRTVSVNLNGTRNVLAAAVSSGSVKRFVLLSSSGLYRQFDDADPCDENHPLDLLTEYARAKRAVEIHMAEYETLGGFPILAARVGPIYGNFEHASSTRPDISMVQKLVDALGAKRPIRITGTDMYRDWTHAEDVALALDLLLFIPDLNHRIYNVSAGVGVSANDIIDLFAGHGLQVERVQSAKSAEIVLSPSQNRKTLVIERLRADTAFAPHFDIRTGIAHLIASTVKMPLAGNNQETIAR